MGTYVDIHGVLPDNTALSEYGVQPMDENFSKKPLKWAELGFQYVKTDFRYSAIFQEGKWLPGSLVSEENLIIHEGSPSLHYAQQCFEGMKAQTTQDDRVVLFRPNLNSERMNRTASRLLMPEVPHKLFIEAVEEVVRANYAWIPPYGSGAALYIRPMLIGVGENLGLKPARAFEFRVFVSPVGPYYKSSGLAAISLAVSDFDRAAPQGTGSDKAGANYAGGLLATLKAQELGASEALYLDSASHRFIDEAGSANIVIVLKTGELITPSSEAILPSITKRSVMEIASEQFGIKTVERAIDLRVEFNSFAEMGACGTAAVLSPIGRIYFDSEWHILNGDGYTVGPVMQKLYDSLVQLQRGEVEDKFCWLHEVKI